MSKTTLQKIQYQIDKCNDKRGCDYFCSKAKQQECELLRAHAKRMSDCREWNLPIQYW